MFYSDNNKILPFISKKNEEIILNVLIILITNLLSLILYFILIGCYNGDGSNICINENYEGWLINNITLPINKFTEPLQGLTFSSISNLFDYRYPYLWIIIGLVVSYVIISNRPSIVDNKSNNTSNNSENLINLNILDINNSSELGSPCNNLTKCNNNDYCHVNSETNEQGSCRRIFKHKL